MIIQLPNSWPLIFYQSTHQPIGWGLLVITFLPRDLHRLCIFLAQSRSSWSAILPRNFGLHIQINLCQPSTVKTNTILSESSNNWISLVMPVWWCPWLKLCARFLKVCTEELLQFGRRDSHVWRFIWKVAKSRQNNICRKRHRDQQTQPHDGRHEKKKDNLLTFDLPGVSLSFMSTKYLSSSNSLAFCTWCKMGPVQYISLKLIYSCELLNRYDKGQMRISTIHRHLVTESCREAIKPYHCHCKYAGEGKGLLTSTFLLKEIIIKIFAFWLQ